jgi:TolB-like protein/Tfp pilus assembly protein PilF
MVEKIRQLAAIMFTDMVGYTAMMQVDEQKAKQNRDRHRQVLKDKTQAHHGLILQYYGDGTLSVFGSAIEAVLCAVEIQTELQKDPQIPLRIGLNIGDVVYDDDGIYGDGVNVASRIEAMSVAGGILISDKIYDEIKNHPELPAMSLGKFNLKNVKRSIEIYALANKGLKIPSATDIKGKMNQTLSSIAVLPFVNMSIDPENEYFSDGITEELINALTKVGGLRVTSRTSSFAFKDKREDVRDIGKQLDVSTVLEGSVRKAGDRIRVSAQLINTSDGYHIWSEIYDRKLADIFEVQDELSKKIANTLREKLSIGDSKTPLVKSYTQNIEAYNIYLKGIYYWNKWNPDSVKQSIEFFQKASELEPEFPLAYSGLSRAYSFLGATGFLPSKSSYPKAKEYAMKALEIDDQLSDSHLTLAMVKFLFDWDWQGAEQCFKKAIELNPGSAETYQYYRMYLNVMGREEEAIAAAEKAVKLDPLSVNVLDSLADAYFHAGQYDRAIAQYQKILELDPDFRTALYSLGWAYWQKGETQRALETFKEAQHQTGHALKGLTQLGYAYAKMGMKKEALDCLAKLKQRKKIEKNVSFHMDFAVLYSGLNEFDKVFYHLDRAYEEHFGGLIFITGRHWQEIKSDKRYHELLKKMGLKYNH